MVNLDSPIVRKLFLATITVEVLAVVGLTIAIMKTGQSAIELGIVLIVLWLFLLYFAIDGVVNENKFALVGFIVATLVECFYVIYQFIKKPTERKQHTVLARFVIVLALTSINLFLSWIVLKSFGWKLYKKVGADSVLVAMYKTYQKFTTVLRIDLLAQVLLALMAGIYIFTEDQQGFIQGPEFIVDVIAVVLNFGWVVLGWQAIRRENIPLLWAFITTALVAPVYIIVKGVLLRDKFAHGDSFYLIPIIIVGVFTVITRISVLIWTFLTWRNFGQGLKTRVFNTTETSTPILDSSKDGKDDEDSVEEPPII